MKQQQKRKRSITRSIDENNNDNNNSNDKQVVDVDKNVLVKKKIGSSLFKRNVESHETKTSFTKINPFLLYNNIDEIYKSLNGGIQSHNNISSKNDHDSPKRVIVPHSQEPQLTSTENVEVLMDCSDTTKASESIDHNNNSNNEIETMDLLQYVLKFVSNTSQKYNNDNKSIRHPNHNVIDLSMDLDDDKNSEMMDGTEMNEEENKNNLKNDESNKNMDDIHIALVYLTKSLQDSISIQLNGIDQSYLMEIQYLKRKDEIEKRFGSLQPTDVALLLMPWLVKQVFGMKGKDTNYDNKNHHNQLVCKALVVSLSVLFHLKEEGSIFSLENDLEAFTSTTDLKIKYEVTSNTATQKFLTQSCLNKLIPKIAFYIVEIQSLMDTNLDSTSTTTTTTSTDQMGTTLHSCCEIFQILTKHVYRPTLNVACESLLIPIVNQLTIDWIKPDDTLTTTSKTHLPCDSAMEQAFVVETNHKASLLFPEKEMNKNKNEATTRLLFSIVELISTLHFSRKGNPKTSFQVFASKATLLAFSKLYVHFERLSRDEIYSMSYRQLATTGQSMIRTILLDGLFHVQHHCVAFHSILLQPIIKMHEEHNSDTNKNKATKKLNRNKRTKGNEGVEEGNDDSKGNPDGQAITKFQSYQEELLATLNSSLQLDFNFSESIADVNEQEVRKAEIQSQIKSFEYIVQFTPTLVKGFYQRIKEWDESGRNIGNEDVYSGASTLKKHKHLSKFASSPPPSASNVSSATNSKKVKDDISLIQFELFTRVTKQLLDAMKEMDVSNNLLPENIHLPNTLTQTIHQMLLVLLEFNVYIPSNDRMHRHQYKFLKDLTIEIFIFSKKIQMLSVNPSEQEKVCSIPIRLIDVLHCLVKLNHTLLHEKLVDVFQFCITNNEPVACLQSTVSLIETLIETYRQLRHQKHLFLSLLKVIEQIDGSENLDILLQVLNEERITSSLSKAIQASPILQVKEIIETIKTWITDQCHKDSDAGTLSKRSFDVVVTLSIILFRSVRVESGTAKEVIGVCKGFVSDVIEVMALKLSDDATSSTDFLLDATLTLTGWLLDLHSRCSFWIGRHDEMDIPSKINCILKSVLCSFQLDTAHLYPFLDGLQFITSHRLRILHTQIFEQEQLEQADVTKVGDSQTMIEEAKTLASFIFTCSQSKKQVNSATNSNRWIMAVKCFSTWSAYAKVEDVTIFLTRIFEVFVVSNIQHYDSQIEKVTFTPPSVNEIECVSSMLQDVSFYENKMVRSLGRIVIMDYVSECLSSCFSKFNGSLPSCCYDLLNSLPEDRWQTWGQYEYAQVAGTVTTIDRNSERDNEDITLNLICATNSVKLMNGFSHAECSPVNVTYLFQVSLVLDHICRSLIIDNVAIMERGVILLTSLRHFMVDLLDSMDSNGIEDFTLSDRYDDDLLCGLLSSSVSMCTATESTTKKQTWNYICTTGRMIQVIFRKAPSHVEFLAPKITKLITKISTKKNSVSHHALANLCRSVIQNNDFTSEGAIPLVTAMTELATRWSLDIVPSSDIDFITVCQSEIFLECFLLLGDIICVANIVPKKVLHDMEEITCRAIRNVNSLSDEVFNSILYVIGVLVETKKVGNGLADTILDYIPTCRVCNHLLGAIYVQLVSRQENPAFERAVSVLLDSHTEYDVIGVRQQLILLVLQYVKDENHISILKKNSYRIFSSPLVLFNPYVESDMWSYHLKTACSIYDELMKRRELFAPKERDHSLLLSYMNSSFICTTTNANITTRLHEQQHDEIFTAFSNLLGSMFNRYSKQLYAVVPSVVSLLHTMMRNILYGDDDDHHHVMTELSIRHRCQYYTKICEDLVQHKDVYKKHMIGLLLEFVNALEFRNGLTSTQIDTVRRDQLLPAIYYLLDTMSAFETDQLNAMMSTKGKVFFRPIHMNYEKQHVYKGS